MRRFEGKVVIVTGATSGIGRGAAQAFAEEGAQVVVAGTSAERGEAAVAKIVAAGGRAVFTPADVTDSRSVDGLVQSTVAAFGRLDVYCSNAGIFDDFTSTPDVSDELWAKVMAVNTSACFYGARAAFPHLRATKGSIVITASIASISGIPGGAAYITSKFAIAGLLRRLALDFAKDGVRVNAVAPGPILTEMVARGQARDPESAARIGATVPLGRAGEICEVTAPILFLASDAASYITGAMLSVDGGMCAN